MLDAAGELLISRLVDLVTAIARRKLASRDPVAEVNSSGVTKAVQRHLRMISKWASEISFHDLRGSKRLRDSFVDLDLYLGPAVDKSQPEWNERSKVSDLSAVPGHLVLLGDPGSGKTTSLKRSAVSLLSETDLGKPDRLVLLVRLRELVPDPKRDSINILTRTLLGTVGLGVTFKVSCEPEEKRAIEQRVLIEFLEWTTAVVMVDGFDEVNALLRDSVLAELRQYFLHLHRAKILLTCRTGDFVFHIENSNAFVLQPLSPGQVIEFATKWLGGSAPHFLSKVAESPYSGSEIRPLTLAHFCALYDRFGDVPEKPRDVYRKIVRLYLEDWDAERSVRRQSKYADFGVDRKAEFLEAVAFQLTSHTKTTQFNHSQLRDAYLNLHLFFNLPKTDAEKVVKEIESHTGLVVEVKSGVYEFTHKSIQEYLAASYILKLPSIPRGIERFPSEAALVIALSSNSTRYFGALVHLFASTKNTNISQFTEPFIHRLLVERVDFVTSAELGCGVLWLVLQTYATHVNERSLLEPSQAVKNFLALPAVSQSIRAVASRSGGMGQGDSFLAIEETILGYPVHLRFDRDTRVGQEVFRILSQPDLEQHH